MKRKNKGRNDLAMAVLAMALLFCLCACGRRPESHTDTDAAGETETAVPSAAAETGTHPAASSAEEPAESSSAGTAEEDPWAEGYFLDEALTAALRQRFATENTNDTDESHPSRTMTEDFLAELDRRAGLWLYEGVPDRETEQAMLALSFRFPGEAQDAEHGLKSVRAGVYGFKGNDPDALAARIRLGNAEPCFYLFLRAYYSETEDRSRIYMINGLVW